MKSSQVLRSISLVIILIFACSCPSKKAWIQAPPPETQAKVGKVSVIQKISFTEEENYTRIHIEGSETILPPFYKLLTDPLRVAIDVPNIDLREIKGPIKVGNGTIGEIITTQYDDKGRIEIGLDQMANYNISKEDKNLIIDVEKVKKTPEVREAKKGEEVVKEKGIEVSPAEAKKEEKPSTAPGGPTPVAAKPLNKAKEILNVSLEQKKDFVAFNIVADGKLENFNAFKLDSPARLVLDIWEVETRYPKKEIKTKNPFIKVVRIGQHPDKLRFVFDSLKSQLPPYQINPIENRLIVSIGSVPQPSEPQILLKEGSLVSPKVQVKAPIDFKQIDNKSRVVVTLTGEPNFESYTISKKTIIVDIKNAFVPKHLQRGLDTSQFESAVDSINIQNIKTGKVNDVRISIKLREEVPFETTKEGKVLFIDIEKPKELKGKIEPVPMVKKEEVPVKAEKEAAGKEEVKKEEEKPLPELKEAEKISPTAEEKPKPQPLVVKKVEEERRVAERVIEEGGLLGKKVYTGRRLSLDFKDADIKNILRLIAEVSNLNIIAGDDVTGKITMRLVDVPWDQALDIILQTRSLGMSRVGNVIRIAPVDSLKKEVQAELEAKRAKEKLEDLITELIPINYATAKDLVPQIKHVLSERGDIKTDERTNILIVKDIARNVATVRSLVKSLDTKTPQVLIEARIVEASMTFQRELGIKWGFEIEGTRGDYTTRSGGGTVGTTLGTATRNVIDLPAIARFGVPGGVATSGILEAIFSRGSIWELDIAISAHENKGDVKIISSPKIATLDNREASIEQGLRIPYPKLTTEGTVTTDFIDANIKLTVTPHVTNDGNIKLNIKAKKDAPDFKQTVLGVPSIDKKEAITEVLVKDNGVVAIGGIYTIEKTDADEGIPLLNKIPLLGWLFKREVKDDTRKDLLIFISPKINKDQI